MQLGDPEVIGSQATRNSSKSIDEILPRLVRGIGIGLDRRLDEL